jgi:hypothetical protein
MRRRAQPRKSPQVHLLGDLQAPERSRSVRRVRSRHPLHDPVTQAVGAMLGAMLAAVSAAISSAIGSAQTTYLLIGFSLVFLVYFVALAARAVKRGKTVQYWHERRRLRFDLRRERAYRDLTFTAIEYLHRRETEPVRNAALDETFERMVAGTYRVFGPNHDDLAVLLVHQTTDRCWISHSHLSPGSRWHELHSGKQCRLHRDFEDRLAELAPYRPAYPVAWRNSDRLWIVVLHVSPLSESEEEIWEGVPRLFEIVASRWTPPVLVLGPEGEGPDHGAEEDTLEAAG